MTSSDTRARTRVVPRAGFRPDIEGLRAIAIGLVLVYHAGVRFLPGGFIGVDVFFVLSGFLITGLLIRELEQYGRVSLSRFYARRAKRLLPATGLVLVVTAVLTWWSTSVVEWRTFGGDIIGAAVYVVNWVLAGRSVDYLAEDVGLSPVQHFWSLAVEEQFYIVWPLLLILVGWWVRRRTGARLRPVMTAGILLIAAPSFLWSVYLTVGNPERAFFVSTTRLWEMGIGALVAIGATQWERLSPALAAALGWLGLAAVTLSGFIITAETPWPGYAALWPTLGTAAVIVSGFAPHRAAPATLLAWRPAVWVGGLSYSLYLWHWPLIISATARWGELGAKRGLLVVAASFVPAYLSYRFIENPIRFAPALSRSNWLALSVGANFSLIGVLAGMVLVFATPISAAPSAADDREASGAGALATTGTAAPAAGSPGTLESLDSIDWFTPGATDASADVSAGAQSGCQVDQVSADPVLCEYGDTAGEMTVAVVGDSKALQWQTALDEIAQDHGWHMHSYTKSACAFASGMQPIRGGHYTSCAEWNEGVLDEIDELAPDVVITTSRVNSALADLDDMDSRSTDAMEEATVETWQQLVDGGFPVVAILDNPSPGKSVYECVADNPDDLAACSFDRDEGVASSSAPVFEAAAQRVPDVRTVDIRDWVCPDAVCVPVIGNVLVYRQTSHITDTYIGTLRPMLEAELVPAVNDAIAAG